MPILRLIRRRSSWSCSRNPEAEERLNHLGVEVFDEAEIASATERFEAAGITPEVQHKKTCCHATQNKVWALGAAGAALGMVSNYRRRSC